MKQLTTKKRINEENEIEFIPVIDGKEQSLMAYSEDVAILLGLGIKYDGINSQFAKFACRMLNIKSGWAE